MGFAQERLAEEAGLPRKTIYNTEKYGSAATRTIEKLARVFGVTVATMLEPDVETAEAVFLAKQVDRLSEGAKQTFFRSISSAVDRESKRAEVPAQPTPRRAPSVSTNDDSIEADRQFASVQVPALFDLPKSDWHRRLDDEPCFISVTSAWEMLAQGDRLRFVDPRQAVNCFKLALDVIERLDVARKGTPHELRATAWKELAWTLRSLGEYAEAEAAIDNAEESANLCANRESMLARVRLTRAILLTTMERYEEALLLVRESRAMFSDINDQARYSMAIEQEAIILIKRKDGINAIPILKRLLKESADDETKARRYCNLTVAFEFVGDFGSARKALEKACVLHEKLGSTHHLGMDRWTLGRIIAKSGDLDDGLKRLERACQEFRQLEDADTAVRIELDICEIEIEHHRQTSETLDRLRAAAAYAIEKRLPQSECRALLYLQQLGRTAKVAHIRYVKDFIEDLAKHPHREFVPPEIAA